MIGFATTPKMWKRVIEPFKEINCISYKDYSNYGYENYDLYIFHSIACRLNIKEERLLKAVYLQPAFKVLFPYSIFIKSNPLYNEPLSKVKNAMIQYNSRKQSVVSNNITKSSIIIKTDAMHFDFLFKPKRMRKTLYSIIFKFKESNND